jgi:hypothetical protein
MITIIYFFVVGTKFSSRNIPLYWSVFSLSSQNLIPGLMVVMLAQSAVDCGSSPGRVETDHKIGI